MHGYQWSFTSWLGVTTVWRAHYVHEPSRLLDHPILDVAVIRRARDVCGSLFADGLGVTAIWRARHVHGSQFAEGLDATAMYAVHALCMVISLLNGLMLLLYSVHVTCVFLYMLNGLMLLLYGVHVTCMFFYMLNGSASSNDTAIRRACAVHVSLFAQWLDETAMWRAHDVHVALYAQSHYGCMLLLCGVHVMCMVPLCFLDHSSLNATAI
jgi:hypothetical protein